ncbi:uncharacterized protein V1513DRAFT_434415 [Lipomyces chichibuensis]|uniref:uncharacterized protein n=1 Tax=Lipomyces chichibuensis TaxID=1546026 RepID=UPI0033440054
MDMTNQSCLIRIRIHIRVYPYPYPYPRPISTDISVIRLSVPIPKRKLLAVTADNAANNETLVSELYFNLAEKFRSEDSLAGFEQCFRYQGLDSYIRCTAHVLNKAGDHSTAIAACDLMQRNNAIGPHASIGETSNNGALDSEDASEKTPNRLKDKFIEYCVESRWNSTHRMLRDAFEANKKRIENQTHLPPFTTEDWKYLQQIEAFLAKFEEFTLVVSQRQPQIRLTLPIYYEVHDILDDAAAGENEFSCLHSEIAAAASAGLKKFQKYYDLMDGQDSYRRYGSLPTIQDIAA